MCAVDDVRAAAQVLARPAAALCALLQPSNGTIMLEYDTCLSTSKRGRELCVAIEIFVSYNKTTVRVVLVYIIVTSYDSVV